MEGKGFYRRNLPHLQPAEGTLFITYRLYGSIPQTVIKRLQEEYHEALRRIEAEHKKKEGIRLTDLPLEMQDEWKAIKKKKRYEEDWHYFEQFDAFLDGNLNEPYWLKLPEIAQLVADSIHFLDNLHYKLWAYCIMSNHVHLLVTMLSNAPVLWKVLQNRKKYTAVHANKLLGLSGRFWEAESYDHLVRDSTHYQKNEFERILSYILNNPVKAKIATNWNDWKWSYCHPDLLSLLV